MVYVAAVTFLPIPKDNARFADTVLGFILGTVIATPITFFYGSSKSSAVKDAAIRDMLPKDDAIRDMLAQPEYPKP